MVVALLPLIKSTDDVPVLMPRWKSQLDSILANQLLAGQSTTANLSTTPTVVFHSLGRVPNGWIITDLNAAAEVYRPSPMTNTTITLQASAPCTVQLWIY